MIDGATGAELGSDVRISKMGGLGNTTYNAFTPDVAYNSTDNQYLVVWFGDDSSWGLVNQELEIFGQRVDPTISYVGNYFRISDAGGTGAAAYDATRPAVAYNALENEYLVVWQGEDNIGGLVDGELEIFGQRINAGTGAEFGVNDFRVSDMGGTGDPDYNGQEPAVACSSTPNEYLAVWEGDDDTGELTNDEFEIFGQRVAPPHSYLPLVLRQA